MDGARRLIGGNRWDQTDDGSDRFAATDCTGEHQLKCHNGRCITTEYRCDGDNDCGDNTDEIDCRESTLCLDHFNRKGGGLSLSVFLSVPVSLSLC